MLRVLLIEDNPGDARLVREMLREVAPAEVDLSDAGSMNEGLAAAAGGAVDLILLDLSLPDAAELEAFHTLQRELPEVPVILITGRDDARAAAAALVEGAQDYLVKGSFEGPELHRAIRYGLERHRLTQDLRRIARDMETRARQQRGLARITRKLAGHLDLDVILQSTVDEVAHNLGVWLAMVARREPGEARWRVLATAGPGRATIDPGGLAPAAVPWLAAAIEALGPVTARGLDRTPLLPGIPDAVEATALAAVVPGASEPLGVLAAVESKRELSVEDCHFLSAAAGLLGSGVERSRVEAARQEEQARFRGVVENLNEAVVISDLDGQVTYANPQAAAMGGMSPGGLGRRTIRDLLAGTDEEFIRQREEARREGRSEIYEFEFRRPDGSTFWAEVHASPFRNAAGEIVGRLAAVTDVTERRRSEERLRRIDRLEAVGQLAGGIAHDFNNLITAILGYCALVDTKLGTGHPVERDVEEIRRAGERAASLTRQLLAFSGRQVLEPQRVDLNEVVRGVEGLLHRLLEDDVVVEIVLSDALPPVLADPGRLEQVIVNLAVNARDAMPGGGCLTLETAAISIDEDYGSRRGVVRPGRYVLLAVSDTGSGMDAATQEHIFEPFFSTKAPGQGTGLGLSTVYGIVKQSGGYVWVYSEPGQGARFKIYLPQVDGVAEPVRTREAQEAVRGGSETVLVVEDNNAVRFLVVEMLETLGYRVLEAAGGQEALEVVGAHPGPLDLVVTDVVMADMKGPELAEEVSRRRPKARFLFMSGYSGRTIYDSGYLREGMPFIEKPFDGDQLARRVRQVLAEKTEG